MFDNHKTTSRGRCVSAVAAGVLFAVLSTTSVSAQPPGDPSAQPNPSNDTVVKPPGAPPNQGTGSSGDPRGDKAGGRLNPAVPTVSRQPTPSSANPDFH